MTQSTTTASVNLNANLDSGTEPIELAQALAQTLAIGHKDWHRLQANRSARAKEQTAVALVYLLKGDNEQALAHLQQAAGWLDRSISSPGCPH